MTYPVFFKTSIRIVHLLVKLYIAALTGESTQYTQKAKKYTTKSTLSSDAIALKSRNESTHGTSTPNGAQAPIGAMAPSHTVVTDTRPAEE